MFQVLLQYFEDRFASFYVEEPVNNYNELLDRVKKAIPVLRGVGNEQIVVSYKDVSLQTFINIDRDETLHVLEAFRNASPCGSEIYRRVHLKVRESDSPFLLKRRSNLAGTSAESTSTTQPKSLLPSFASSVNSERSAVEDVCDWKISKGNQLTQIPQYSKNSTTSGVETVRSFQPGFPGKYVPCCRKCFTILDTVCGDNPTTSAICACFVPDDHKAIICSLFSTEVG